MPASRPPAWYLVSLRAQGEHAAMRRAAARHGGGLLPLSPWRLQPRHDEASRGRLEVALRAPVLVFTSPAAVRAAAALVPLAAQPGRHWLAVGAGTAAALRRAGIADARAPSRMDSEGLLALPALAAATRVGLVTAPEGRGLLAAALAARGTEVVRADVYDRVPVPLSGSAVARLAALDAPACLALSSEQALRLVLGQLPPDAARALRSATAVAASERLAAIASDLGWQRVVSAGSPRPAALAGAAASALGPG
ncbi:uroporphyrinogen-III synthase [Pseudoxanthomonas sp. 10H]|uniref:uroporphyrinogen-III synthase n=1 Tax=Pseudoxanthomonas sp. 10H TaxID=3242729 RepID=UPI0035568DDD